MPNRWFKDWPKDDPGRKSNSAFVFELSGSLIKPVNDLLTLRARYWPSVGLPRISSCTAQRALPRTLQTAGDFKGCPTSESPAVHRTMTRTIVATTNRFVYRVNEEQQTCQQYRATAALNFWLAPSSDLKCGNGRCGAFAWKGNKATLKRPGASNRGERSREQMKMQCWIKAIPGPDSRRL